MKRTYMPPCSFRPRNILRGHTVYLLMVGDACEPVMAHYTHQLCRYYARFGIRPPQLGSTASPVTSGVHHVQVLI